MSEHYWNTEINGKTVSSVKVEHNKVTLIFTDATHATIEGYSNVELEYGADVGVIFGIHQPETKRKVNWP